ncbi:MAG TPA: HEAT repeat domain-containing protein [Gammaproteobacteria bacterium]|nr:HEAT repeat domain-containing protein [Gammaproteobacteria bacterium]
MKKVRSIFLLLSLPVLLIVSGCAPSSYVISDPKPSHFAYENAKQAAPTRILLTDERADKVFSGGTLKADLKKGKTPVDPVAFLKENTEKELAARGVSVSFDGQPGGNSIMISRLKMLNHRSNAYSPFITFTSLEGTLSTPARSQRIAVYVKRGKVPVWGFQELVEPTLNEPLDLLVKEFATKISNALYNLKASDSYVDELITKTSGSMTGKSYLDVYQLGFSNNQKAVPHLVKLVKHSDEYVRLAAISSLGNLKAESQLDFLKSLSHNAESWSERGMALKAIGDIGTADALAFLKQESERLKAKSDKEESWSQDIINLYLD